MELILLALLLMNGKEQPSEWKNTLSSALNFYRENRAMLQTLVALTQKQPPAPQQTAQEKPPREGAALGNFLEEFLKTNAF